MCYEGSLFLIMLWKFLWQILLNLEGDHQDLTGDIKGKQTH